MFTGDILRPVIVWENYPGVGLRVETGESQFALGKNLFSTARKVALRFKDKLKESTHNGEIKSCTEKDIIIDKQLQVTKETIISSQWWEKKL